MAQAYRETSPNEEIQFSGTVTDLSRQESTDHGTIKVKTEISDRWRTVTLTIPYKEYPTAMEAHKSEINAFVEGIIDKRTTRWIFQKNTPAHQVTFTVKPMSLERFILPKF